MTAFILIALMVQCNAVNKRYEIVYKKYIPFDGSFIQDLYSTDRDKVLKWWNHDQRQLHYLNSFRDQFPESGYYTIFIDLEYLEDEK